MVTRWSPDTCGCVIEYDENINLTSVVQRCPAHQTLLDNPSIFNSVKEENSRKNIGIHDLLLNNAPTSLFDIDAESGNRVFKKNIVVDWTWSGVAPNRVLTINVTGVTLTTNQKNAIKTFLDNRFGVGKVVLV